MQRNGNWEWRSLWVPAFGLAWAITCTAAAPRGASAQETDQALADQVQALVRELESDRLEERDVAEKKLIELAGESIAGGDRLLELLPQANPQMPPGLQTRLTRIRRKVDERLAHAAVVGTKITLDAQKMPLGEVLHAIEKQTGNRLVDYRRQFGQEAPPIEVTLAVTDEPFWQAVDKLLDQTKLAIYNFAEADALALVAQTPGAASRLDRASYVGPFRVEVTQVESRHDFRRPSGDGLNVNLEVAWEPRLRPIVISQPLAEVFATDESSQAIPAPHPEQSLDVEIQSGSPSTTLALPFQLPARTVPAIKQLRGIIHALVPGRTVKFQFDKFGESEPQTQQRAGVAVTLDRIKRDGDILEVHMRLRLDEPGEALASHRGWVFQNPSYLVDKEGERIDNAGFETILQSESEVGIVYLFDVAEENDTLTWVYETPAAIIETPVAYELRDIKLP